MTTSTLRPLYSLSWQSVLYGIGIFGRQIAVYVALPFFTTAMPQKEYGVVSVTAAFLAFFNTLSNAGLPAATFRFYNDTKDTQVRRITLGSAQILITFYAIVAAVVLFTGAEQLSHWLLGSLDYAYVLRIVAMLLFVQSLVNYGGILLRIQVRPLANSIQGLFQIVIQLSLALVLVMGYDLGARGYWIGHLVGAIVGLGLMLWLVRSAMTFQFSSSRMKEMLTYGLPLIPAVLALWSLRLVDRSLVVLLAGLDEVAVYEVGCKIGMLAGMVALPFGAAWPQFAFSAMHEPQAPEIYRDALTYLMTACAFAVLVVTAFRVDLVQIMAPNTYAGAASVVFWIALSQIAWVLYPVLSVSLKITKRTSYIALVTVSAATINIVLNVLLIPVKGIVGAAMATLAGYVALSLGVYVFGQRFYELPIDWKRIMKVALAFSMTALFIIHLEQFDIHIWGARIFKALGTLLFPILLLLLGFINPNQYRELYQSGSKFVRERLRRV